MSKLELVQAVKALAKDNLTTGPHWEVCHNLCQAHEGEPDYDWVHGLVHAIEGDVANAGYWYRRAGKTQVHDDTKLEWEYIAVQVG